MLINSKGPLLCNEASVMELIEKPLVEHLDNIPTVYFLLLNSKPFDEKIPVQWSSC